jgi:predicted RNase H-like HicB family nuclease
MNYIAYLHKDRKSDFGVSFPDFPGCITAGRTLQEAQQMAVEALSLHIQGMTEDGEEIPEPSSIDALAHDLAHKDGVLFLVEAELPDRTIRVNITAREKQIEEIDRLAKIARMTRSAYLVASALKAGGKSSTSRGFNALKGKKFHAVKNQVSVPKGVHPKIIVHKRPKASPVDRSGSTS